ncbi:hypothetical protein FVEG_00950 [Fusarium verticillioides 7600]|uniref:Extracellular membrane protein CFEM domain-containing protein n=1 Tax=Gibberella moniliformis (strain M3125 / FGSC 7600) TaxID=334819 RepID=W7LPA5_GIBM7|nr:hypothetical protein FVEG_00950 [Fusarium verticillioides 7600]EWG37269.1 hypothetical protein FVEG_00950 [Fusarium verticillioides 7600]
MRFTSIFVAGAFATMAAAQSKTASVSPAQQSQLDCLDACDAGDVKCQSYCITVPSPDEKNINATTECVAACPKGKGSASDTEKYSVCLQDCIANNYWKTVSGTPRETGDAGSKDEASSAAGTATASAAESDATATDASETSGSASGSASGTASGSAASSTETGNAATALVSGVSLLGLVAAVFAL